MTRRYFLFALPFFLLGALVVGIINFRQTEGLTEGEATYLSAWNHQSREEWDEAKRLYFQSIPLLEAENNQSWLGGAYNNLGDIEKTRGDFEEAIDLYSKSLKLRKSSLKSSLRLGEASSHLLGIAESAYQLGDIARIRGELYEAEYFYYQSLTLKEVPGNFYVPHVIRTYYNLALIAFERSDEITGCKHLQKAKSFYPSLTATKFVFSKKDEIPPDISQVYEDYISHWCGLRFSSPQFFERSGQE